MCVHMFQKIAAPLSRFPGKIKEMEVLKTFAQYCILNDIKWFSGTASNIIRWAKYHRLRKSQKTKTVTNNCFSCSCYCQYIFEEY